MRGRTVVAILGLLLAAQGAADPAPAGKPVPVVVTSAMPFPHEYFGTGVAVDAGTMLVGAFCSATVPGCPGTVQAFERQPDGRWAWRQTLHAPEPAYLGGFGLALALDGDVAVAGEPSRQRAHILERGADGRWAVVQTLEDPDPPVPGGAPYGLGFGWAVDLHGGTVAIGSHRAPHPVPSGAAAPSSIPAGAVHVYVRGADGAWSHQARLSRGVPAPDGFGYALDLDGDRLIVNAWLGLRALVFERVGTTWNETAAFAPREDEFSFYGVALDGDVALTVLTLRDPASAGTLVARVWHAGPGGWVPAGETSLPTRPHVVRVLPTAAADGCFAVGLTAPSRYATQPVLLAPDAAGAPKVMGTYLSLDPDRSAVYDFGVALRDGILAVADRGLSTAGGLPRAGAVAVYAAPPPCGPEAAPAPDGGVPAAQDPAPPPDGAGPGTTARDSDRDGIQDEADNCPAAANGDQADPDRDGHGEACDPDGEAAPAGDAGGASADAGPRGDGPPAPPAAPRVSECQGPAVPGSADLDGDGLLDACDPDLDGDGVANAGPPGAFLDRCPLTADPGQEDLDGDGIGDACDPLVTPPPAIREAPPAEPAVERPSSATLALALSLAGALLGSAGWLAWSARSLRGIRPPPGKR